MFIKKGQGKKTKSTSSEKKAIEGLTNEQKMIFDKYANKYNIDKDPTKEKIANVEREKYVYEYCSRKTFRFNNKRY